MAGTETEHLIGALERLRSTFRWKADGLDAVGLQTRLGVSTLTLGGLLQHLALVEDYKFTHLLAGEPIGPPWDTGEEFAMLCGDAPTSSIMSNFQMTLALPLPSPLASRQTSSQRLET